MKPIVAHPALSERLTIAMGYRRRTQTDVAQQVGVSLNTLSRIARGETLSPGADLLRALALVLEVPSDYLLGLSDEIERKS